MIKVAQEAYAQGAISAMSELDLDDEVKIAALQVLEKVAKDGDDEGGILSYLSGLASRAGSGLSDAYGATSKYLGGAATNLMNDPSRMTAGQAAALLGAGGAGAAGLYGAYKGLTSDPAMAAYGAVGDAAVSAKDALVSGVAKLRSGKGELDSGEIAALSAAGLLGAGAIGGLGYAGYKALQGTPDNANMSLPAGDDMSGLMGAEGAAPVEAISSQPLGDLLLGGMSSMPLSRDQILNAVNKPQVRQLGR